VTNSAFDEISITGIDSDVTVCVTAVAAGAPVPE
jgi:hypothetical protein